MDSPHGGPEFTRTDRLPARAVQCQSKVVMGDIKHSYGAAGQQGIHGCLCDYEDTENQHSDLAMGRISDYIEHVANRIWGAGLKIFLRRSFPNKN
jgi:hypothetical protein